MGNKKSKSFLAGFLAGAIGGVLAGLMSAPKSGKELREDIKKKTASLSNDVKTKYIEARKSLTKKVNNLKKAGKKIDKTKYTKLINDVLTEFKNDSKVTKETAEKVGELLKNDFEMLVGSVKTQPKKGSKNSKK